jgi:hypothetical protein
MNNQASQEEILEFASRGSKQAIRHLKLKGELKEGGQL